MADGANEEVVKKEEENASEEKPELEEAKSELQDDTNQDNVSLLIVKSYVRFLDFAPLSINFCSFFVQTFN